MEITKKEETLLSELVSFDTSVDKKLDYDKAAKFIVRECKEIGAKTAVIHPEDKEHQNNLNVIAQINNNSDETLAICAHFDTVPVKNEEWKTPPFELVRKNGRIYGRGTNDDKGGIVAILSAIAEAKKAPNLELFFSCDEEQGSKYGMDFVADNYNIKSTNAIIIDGEPKIFIGGSGGFTTDLTITGKGHHAGWPYKATNPIELGIPFLEQMMKFKDIAGKEVSRYTDIDGHRVNGRFVMTVINGGNAKNQIPNKMVVSFNIRCIPEANVENILKQFKEFFEIERSAYIKMLERNKIIDFKISMDENPFIKQSYCGKENSKIVQKMKTLIGETSLHASHGGNDASAFIRKGIDAMSYGTFNDSAHMENEYVLEADLIRVKRTLIRLLESY